jgi:hypothetical protein
MREVISVHVGQAGVQIGNACCKFSKSLLLRVASMWTGSNMTRSSHFPFIVTATLRSLC